MTRSWLSLSAIAALSVVALGACGGKDSGAPTDGGAPDGDVTPIDGSVTPGDGGGDGGSASQCSANRVDLLFMIDNSASMGTKVDYLRVAIPELVGRLAQPNCISGGHVVAKSHDGVCDQGTIEFPPVHDMHVGIVTSSLGPRGGDVCDPSQKTGNLNKHNDDRAELIDRGGADEHPVADMTKSNFLGWFPSVPANSGQPAPSPAITDEAKLASDLQDMLAGVHQLGCGIESQLESWYRFLVQPDPYDSIDSTSGQAKWVGVDQTILQQRHDFLRPDSLVLLVDLSDENDSELDVRSLGGQGYLFNRSDFTPPRGTSACDTNPGDPSCTSCQIMGSDPNCAKGNYTAQNDWGYNLNLRHVHMKQKYGLDVQYPIDRYARGLSEATVPNRDGEYPQGAANYIGNPSCTNPLFAASLPDGSVTDAKALCNLQRGPRTSDFVFYAHIGGVPNKLLHVVPGDPTATALTALDWQAILGKDPAHYDYAGIDPHMIESYAPRAGLPAPSSADTTDPDNGREWITNATIANGVDLEYACTFPLLAPVDCSNPANADTCDCPPAAGTPHDQLPPLCDPNTVTTQIRGKAYPTIRELQVARALGSRGIVASICPVHSTEQSPGDPLYGYRPAVTAIVDRIGVALAKTCH